MFTSKPICPGIIDLGTILPTSILHNVIIQLNYNLFRKEYDL